MYNTYLYIYAVYLVLVSPLPQSGFRGTMLAINRSHEFVLRLELRSPS